LEFELLFLIPKAQLWAVADYADLLAIIGETIDRKMNRYDVLVGSH
jgi:hypothetical protein